MKTAVIGAGSWGTALAAVLASNGHEVAVWDRNSERLAEMRLCRENKRYLPGAVLPSSIEYFENARDALANAKLAVFAVPAQHFAEVFPAFCGFLCDDAVAVNVAKGIDCATLKRLSKIAEDHIPQERFAVLSGPSHAEEVVKQLPAAVVAASKSLKTAEFVQDAFMNGAFRVYTSCDVAGVELGGALKNIIALGAGISDGIGFGDNTRAALMTRGITEMVRLGAAMGADVSTFSGLSGFGDLIVTCSSVHSRNRRCGLLIGQGMKPDEAVKSVGMVVEGIYTAKAAQALAVKYGIEMPITQAVNDIVSGRISAKDAAALLMNRKKKHENEELLKTL